MSKLSHSNPDLDDVYTGEEEQTKYMKNYKDGVADALLYGNMADEYGDGYKAGYDFGITVYCRREEEELREHGWTTIPNCVWFGVDYAESHKKNVLNIRTDVLDLDSNVEGYEFLVAAYKKGDVE